MMTMEQRDLIIIGGGPAGYVAAIRARQLGAKVALIEKDTLGGICLNHGCIPVRALMRGTEFLDLPKKAKDYGVDYGAVEVDFTRMMSRKDTIIRTVVGGVELLMKANEIEVFKGMGRLLSPSEVEVLQEDGSTSQISAPKVIIATGASLQKPDVPGGEGVITTEQALQFTEVPRSLLVVGGGSIGFAFATIFSKLGASVTVIERSPQILPGVDREIVSLLERELRKEKIPVLTDARIKEVGEGEGGESNVVLSVDEEDLTLTAQYILAAEGWVASIEGLGLDTAGVKLSDGGIEVNNRMETGVDGIFVAGDVAGEPMLAHVAFAEGRVAAENALGKQSEIDYSAVPRCINTTPEIAGVGLTEDEAVARGHQVQIGRFPFAANGVATVLGERSGTVKIISEEKYGQILGVHIIGPRATDLIAEAALAMKLDATPAEISSTIYAHPSLSEALMEAALDVTGDALHFFSENK
jgi:dihydrolipoamide dehydrogenase